MNKDMNKDINEVLSDGLIELCGYDPEDAAILAEEGFETTELDCEVLSAVRYQLKEEGSLSSETFKRIEELFDV